MRAVTPIQQATAAYFSIDVDTLVNGGRSPLLVAARQVARYLERHLEKRSFGEIGKLYNCDHSTCVVAYQHIVERTAVNDERYTGAVHAITAAVRSEQAEEAKKLANDPALLVKCPTCGGPLMAQLMEQLGALRREVETLKQSNGKGAGA